MPMNTQKGQDVGIKHFYTFAYGLELQYQKKQNSDPALDNVCKPIKLHSNLEVMFLGKKDA